MSQTEKNNSTRNCSDVSPNQQRGDKSEILFYYFFCFAGTFHKLLSERQKYLGGVRLGDARVIRARRPQTLHSWNYGRTENCLRGGLRQRMGLPKIRDYKEAALCRSLFTPVQPPALVYVQEEEKKKKSAGNPPHGRVIWALCSDTAHEGRAYLGRAHQRSSYRWEEEDEEEGGGTLPPR